MARSDLLLSLVQAGTRGDRPGFRRTLEALVADERGRQHHVVANQLAAYLEPARPEATTSMRPISSPPEGLLDELEPSRTLEDLVLPEVVRDACLHFLDEQRRADLLRSHGLEPRHRLLLIGPPGNGKTFLAEALAGELSLPVLRVRYDAVIGSYLGETAARLVRVFDHARTRQCVLFFDEFDAVGKERGDEHETGEIKRVVNSLLMSVDPRGSSFLPSLARNRVRLPVRSSMSGRVGSRGNEPLPLAGADRYTQLPPCPLSLTPSTSSISRRSPPRDWGLSRRRRPSRWEARRNSGFG